MESQMNTDMEMHQVSRLSPASQPGAPSKTSRHQGVTGLLHSWSDGDEEALWQLVPLVYNELRELARHHLCREREGHTLRSTALVHEAFMRLLEQRSIRMESRSQFFAWMSQVMRRVLVNHAHARAAAKRGAGVPHESLESAADDGIEVALEPEASGLAAIADLDVALRKLETLDSRKGQIIELRFFGGLSVPEVAATLGISTATVKREWAAARAWMLHEIGHATKS
jgi:RNA polymerase sigma factor (TIGR02999 family)